MKLVKIYINIYTGNIAFTIYLNLIVTEIFTEKDNLHYSIYVLFFLFGGIIFVILVIITKIYQYLLNQEIKYFKLLLGLIPYHKTQEEITR